MATKLLVCLVMVAAVSAVPLMRDDFDSAYGSVLEYECSRQCKDTPTKFDYQPSMTYVYEYKAEAETSIVKATEDKAKINIETVANIEVISKCEFALRLQNVRVSHSEPYSDSLKLAERSQDFQRALIKHTLRFSFDDGVIRDICHPSQEEIWVLNFKRGLLSAFQNSMEDLGKDQKIKEVDVSGECVAEYSKIKEWPWERSVKVSKSKNLLACYQHSGLRTFIPMMPYRVASDIQSLPVMTSSHECEHIVSSSKVLQSSVCKESHVFAPFSKQQSGASTKVQQTLTFKVVKGGVETNQDNIESRDTLLFQHSNDMDSVPNSKEAAEQKLKEICEQTKNDIRPETPRLFTELVQIVKSLENSELRNLYRMIKTKRLCSHNDKSMKFLLDTLPIAATPGALELMVTVINNDDIPDLEKKVWLTSVSLIAEPTEDMLPSLVKLVGGKSADQALLPVSALLNTMCRKNVDCDHSYKFKKIVNKINQNIDSYCSSKDRAQLMETLRAIGNVGYGQSFLKTLETCLRSSYAPLEVKVAAADAYRRFQCQEDEENGPLFEVYESQNADSELRIMSFLSLMRCPRDSVLRKISAQLDKEEDVHVGTFVYTHLENLKQTSDPHKQDIAEAVRRLTLKKIEDGEMKTSRCFESSTLLNRLNLGYVADGDLIWSQSSVMPRAVRVNLTVELFGNSINLFEAGARVDGFDGFVKKYFGMEGYLSQNEASTDDLEAFIYARMFGNELFFKHMKGTQEYEKIKSHLNFDKILENLSKQYDFRYTHSQQLMDHSMVIPTVLGLPVKLTVNSSVTVDTETKGKLDLSGVLAKSKPITLSNNIAASAGIEVSGSIMVDAHLYKQGLRMRNTLHTSVSMKSDLMVKERQILNFEITSPEEKQEIFDARSQFFIIHDNFEKEQEMIKENSQEQKSCTGEGFTKVTGIELCGEVRYANASLKEDAPYFPLTGPARATLTMNKKDTQRNYKIFAKWMRNSKKLEAQLQLDTPGSRVDRHISADVTIGTHKNQHVDLVFISPWKKLLLNGKVAKNKDMASVTGSIAVDEDIQYKLTSELKMSRKGKTNQYMPFVEIENNGERITILSGSAIHIEKKEISSNLVLNDLFKKSYSLGGKLTYSQQEKRIELSAGRKGEKPFLFRAGSILKKTGKKNLNYKVDPDFLIQTPKGEIVALKSNGEFQPKPLKVVGSMSLDTIRMRKPITLKVNIRQKKNSYPVTLKMLSFFLTGDVKGKVDVRKNSYSSSMKLNYRTASKKDSITWDGKFLNRSRGSYTQYQVNSNLKTKSMPEYNTNTNLVLTQKKKNMAELTIHYGKKPKADKNKVIQVVASVQGDIKKNMKQAVIKADLKAKMPEKYVDIKISFDHEHTPKKIDSEVKLHLSPILNNDLNVDILIQNKGKSLYNITANGNLEAGGKKYNLKSELTQKSKKRLEHSIIISSNRQKTHALVTEYKNTHDNHRITSNIECTQLEKPLTLDVSADLKNHLNFHVDGSLNSNKQELYSVDVVSKYDEGKAGKVSLEFAHPERKVKVLANINKANNRINTGALINWNVASQEKPVPQVRFTGHLTHVNEPESLLLKGNVKLETPFKKYEKLSSNMNFEKSQSDLKSMGKISWGGIHKQISSEISAKLPISLESAKVSLQAKTPFKNYKDVELEVDHILSSNIKTNLRGKLNKDEGELIFNGKKDINDYSRSVEGDLTLKTPFKSARQIVLTLEHSDDENEINSFVNMNKDGEKYNIDIKKSYKTDRSRTERSGHLNLSGPQRSTQTSFAHKIENGKHYIDASIDSAQNNKKRRYNVDITGSYLDLNHVNLNVDVKSPLRSLRKAGIEIDHQIEEDKIGHKFILIQNRARTGYDIRLKNEQQEKSADVFLLLSPMYENDVYLKSNVQYDNYPVTMSSKISWAPSSVIDLTGSYKAQSQDDLELNLKLTTPFEDLENINMVVSHVLKNSVRVSHLNLDYDVRKMIDVEVRSQNDDQRKLLRLKVKVPSSHFQSLDTGVSIDTKRGMFTKADFELQLPKEENYEAVVSLKVSNNKNVRGKLEMKTPVEGLKHIEGSLVSEGSKNDKSSSLKMSVDDVEYLDFLAKTVFSDDRFNAKMMTQGKLLQILAEKYGTKTEKDDWYNIFIRTFFRDANGKKILQKFIVEFNTEEINQQVQHTASLIRDYESVQRLLSFNVKHSYKSLKDFGIESSLTVDQDTLNGKVLVYLKDNINLECTITDFQLGPFFGLEFGLTRDEDQLETKGKFSFMEFESKFDFLMNNIQRIEFTSTIKTTRSVTKLTKVKYTHEGQDNRISCSLSVEDAKGIVASIDLVGQSSPIHLFSLDVKTPWEGFKKMAISGDYDETKFKGLLMMNEEKQLSLSGSHNNFKNPKFTLKTPFYYLKLLSVNVDGQLSDGSSSFTLQFNDDDQIDGNVAVEYVDLSRVKIISALNSKIDEIENKLKLEVENTVEPSKTSRLLLSLNDVDQIKYTSVLEGSDEQRDIELELLYPSLGITTQRMFVTLHGNTEKLTGKIQLLDSSEEGWDGDIDIDMLSDRKAVLVVHKPRRMEYRFTQESFYDSKVIYLNWDKSNPGANMKIRVTHKDDSNYYKFDKSVSLVVTCPRETFGVEHSTSVTTTNVESSGKIYWGDDTESQLSYQLNLKDQSNRRLSHHDGELKIKLPTRTVGFAGYSKDQSSQHQAETTFSWDLDNDDTKKVGLRATLLKGSHTQADISLILPKEAHVDSTLVMHKGNTILEGQTQIFYSDDSRKTLTIFSKLENNPGQSSYFYSSQDKSNYSIEFGVSHPESRIDMKMVSHLGMDSDRLTTSVGLDYLTSRKQMKNMDLFLEINELKKEINVFAATPYKNVGLSVVRKDQLEWKIAATVDNEEQVSAHLLANPSEKTLNFNWLNNGRELMYSASYPNKTALQLERNQRKDGQLSQDYTILVQLASPDLLQSNLNWRLGLIAEDRDVYFDNWRYYTTALKDLVDEVAEDLEREVTQKYADISSSLIDEVKSVANSLEKEIASLEGDLDQIHGILRTKLKFCAVHVGEFNLAEEIESLQSKVVSYVDNLSIKSVMKRYRQALLSVAQLETLPADEFYKEFVKSIGEIEEEIFGTNIWDILSELHELESKKLQKFWDYFDKIVVEDILDPKPLIDYLNEQMEKLMNLKTSTIITKITQEHLIKNSLKELLRRRPEFTEQSELLQDLEDNQLVKVLFPNVQFGENLEENLDWMLLITIDMLDEELKEMLSPLRRFTNNPITKFDPKKGFLQAEFPLVISLERLDEFPGFEDIAGQVFYYGPEDNASSIPEVTITDYKLQGFDEYQPSRPGRFRHGYMNKRS